MRNDKVKRFNFKRKPMNPCFLMYVAKWIISWPDLKKRDLKLERINMEGLEEQPYLLLVNHSSMVDFNVMLKATHPRKVNNVMTIEGFNDYTEPLMRSLGVIGTRKFITDINLIKNMKYSIDVLKNIFVVFPEARYSLDGCTSYIPDSIGKTAKMLKVPLVILTIHGNFITCPQWNKMNKKTHVEAVVEQVVTLEEMKTITPEEINARIKDRFQYDDFKWQVEHQIKIDHPKRANGLHSLLYKCPSCLIEGHMHSEGTKLWCECCKKEWYMDEYGRLSATTGETEFAHIPDWSNWERECVRKEVEDGTYYFEDDVFIKTLPNAWRYHKQGMGKLRHTPEGMYLDFTYYGEEHHLFKSGKSMESIHIEYDFRGKGDCIDISVPDDSIFCFVSKRDVVTKLSFATEEINKLSK